VRRFKRKNRTTQPFIITSLLDVLIILICFLIRNFGIEQYVTLKDNMELPISTASALTVPTINVIATKSQLLVEDEVIAPIVNGTIPRKYLSRQGFIINDLYKKLLEAAKRSQFIEQKQLQAGLQKISTEKEKQQLESLRYQFQGHLLLQADKDLTYRVLRKILFTAGATNFTMFKLAVAKKE